MKEKFSKSKKLYITIAAIVVCAIFVVVFVVSCNKVNPSFVGTWTSSPISEQAKANLKERKITLSDKFDENVSLNLKLEDGLFSHKATLSLVGMQQEGTWSSSGDNDGKVNIGKTSADLHLDGDTLIMERDNSIVTLKKQ